ncbi:MAG: BrnT family toxin [Pseudomonadota bacterium]
MALRLRRSKRAIQEFDWTTALTREDDRFDYGETRWRALGEIDGRVHVVVFTVRNTHVRLISLRRANARETSEYERF